MYLVYNIGMSTQAVRCSKAANALGVSRLSVIRHCRRLHGQGDGFKSIFLEGECWQVTFSSRSEWRISTSAIERITGRPYQG